VSAMTMDQDYQRHYQMWLGFTRLLRWAIALIIITLSGMAYFLL
jgi:hypothetical protein